MRNISVKGQARGAIAVLSKLDCLQPSIFSTQTKRAPFLLTLPAQFGERKTIHREGPERASVGVSLGAVMHEKKTRV